MKYIRTKDAIFKVTSKAGHIYCAENQNNEFVLVNGRVVEKEANTIEELCDEFDWKWNEKEFPYSKVRQHDRYSGYGDLKRAIREEESYGKYLNQDYEIYGAIWTDKGLQFVARMNSEGALELL